MKQEILNIPIKNLHLWTENPRDPIDAKKIDEEIIDRIIQDSDNKWNIKKLVQKMGEYYDYSELPIVVKKDDKYVVYDGNRRVALLKIIQDDSKYSKYVGQLFRELEPKLLREQTTLPCNVCDENTAVTSIERKHIDNGSWGELERDYFLLHFKNKPKSIFVSINDQTGFLKGNKTLNKRFVKEEVLNEKNLKDIGIDLKEGKLYSKYSDGQLIKIFEATQDALQKGDISTRNNRGKLKTIINKDKSIDEILKNPENSVFEEISISKKQAEKLIKPQKTPATKKKDILFGRVLQLEQGPVNDLYLAVDKVYKKGTDDENILLIVGMSTRLILDVASRIYYRSQGDTDNANQENPYLSFIKLFQKECKDKEVVNYLSITSDFLNKRFEFEALLGKYAHGNISVSKQDVLKMSYVAGDILETYFKTKKE
ncbi:MAG: hypothetical protein WC348_02780 [Patescibacteria group bacterium]|jgi:hypothetical protein